MAVVLATNNATTVLDGSIAAGDLSLAVATGTGVRFPSPGAGQHFYLTLIAQNGSTEIVKVTTRATDTFTIVRAQDGTAAQAFPSGTRAELRWVAAVVTDTFSEIATKATSGDHHDSAAIIAMLGYTPINPNGAVPFTNITFTGNTARAIEHVEGTLSILDIFVGTGAQLQLFGSTYATASLAGSLRLFVRSGGLTTTVQVKPDGTFTWEYSGGTGVKNVWHTGNLTNLNQLTNGPGYVTAATAPVTSVNTKTGAVTIVAGDITSGVFGTARLGSGGATSATFLRGDGTWSNRIVSKLEVGDANFYLNLGAAPEIYFDSADAVLYNRTVNQFEFYTGGMQRAVITNGGRVYAASATYPFGTTVAATNGAGAGAGTLGNAPAAGNPTKWISFDDAGTIRYIPAW